MRKGPVYTERVLFAYVDAEGRVQLEDTLGLKSAGRAELFQKLESGTVSQVYGRAIKLPTPHRPSPPWPPPPLRSFRQPRPPPPRDRLDLH